MADEETTCMCSLMFLWRIFTSYTCSLSSVSVRQIVYPMFMVVSLTLVYRICILHRFLVIVFYSNNGVFRVLQPSQFIRFPHICSVIKIQTYGVTCLNVRKTCYYRIINQFEVSYLHKMFSTIFVHMSCSILDERLE